LPDDDCDAKGGVRSETTIKLANRVRMQLIEQVRGHIARDCDTRQVTVNLRDRKGGGRAGVSFVESMTFRPGEIIGDYEILGPLGKGGMGAVYRVRNVISDRVEAMKEVLPGREQTPDLVDRFCR